jgi:hypothetical protein
VGPGLPALRGGAAGAADALVEQAQAGERKRIWIEGTNLDGKDIRKGVLLPLGDAGPARERLRRIGLTVVPLGDEMQIAQVQFGSQAEKLGLEQGFNITSIELPATGRPRSGCSCRRCCCWRW